ncbi:hypothetical protein SAMN04487974_103132 [Pelagibacterium luteolum]|uniref:Anti-sigma factor NepR domain-containing protein n=2 Tax=Pelagibacterium luteolum TaxID=440168 RepID=A0A1G7UKZ8_9HYPH|nr:hypothetical protein SAMN04487974_103132 [Pelagibacterium luteolum]
MELFCRSNVLAHNYKDAMTLYGENTLTQLSSNRMAKKDDEVENSTGKPGMSPDSQAFIGLKLRELYDDVVAEPVPDRLLELLGKLGEDEKKPKSE